MAAKATIYKALLNIANMDSHYYAEHNLTMAKHPSETDLRLMVRLIAFILNAEDDLVLWAYSANTKLILLTKNADFNHIHKCNIATGSARVLIWKIQLCFEN